MGNLTPEEHKAQLGANWPGLVPGIEPVWSPVDELPTHKSGTEKLSKSEIEEMLAGLTADVLKKRGETELALDGYLADRFRRRRKWSYRFVTWFNSFGKL